MAEKTLWIVYNVTLRQQVTMKPVNMTEAQKLATSLKVVYSGHEFEVRASR